LKDNKTSFHI